MYLYFDIETIPNQSESALKQIQAEIEKEKEKIAAPGNYKDPEKIAEFLNLKRCELDRQADANWRKTALDGGSGHIAAICWAINDGEVIGHRLSWPVVNEREVIVEFFDSVTNAIGRSGGDFGRVRSSPRVVGHNVAGFDLTFVWKRCVVLGIRPPDWMPINPKPWADNVYDTMLQWSGAGRYISMDKLCALMGIPGKGSELGGEEIDGSKVWDFVLAGRIADVERYCAADVERTRELHRRMTQFCASPSLIAGQRKQDGLHSAQGAALAPVPPAGDFTYMRCIPDVQPESDAIDSPPALKLGEINARLGFTLSADFLAQLGFVAHQERSSRLYHERDWPHICAALIRHIQAESRPAAGK